VNGYFDGLIFQKSSVPGPALTMAGYYIGLACWTFNETPQMDLSVDEHPNNGWLSGTLDDLRIYNRVLSGDEILNLYSSFDHTPPSVPGGISTRTASSSQIELRWDPSTDNCRVTGYRVRRDGVAVGEASGTSFRDTGLAAETSHEYSVAALDVGGNISAWSAPVSAQTGIASSPIDIIVDDADGEPYLVQSGAWYQLTSAPGYFWKGCLYDKQKDSAKTLTYVPELPESGEYDVYIRYPGSNNVWPYFYLMDSAVPVDIGYAGATNTVTVNEQANYGEWQLLGRFPFEAGTNGFVRIRTEGTTRYVLGDAVRFVK